MKIPVIIRRVILPLLGFLGLFILIVLIINLSIFDEKLNPEITEMLTPAVMPAENENAYFALWGLTASSDKDIIEAGSNIISRYRSNRDNNGDHKLSSKGYEDVFGGEGFDKQWQKTYPRCKLKSEYTCLANMRERLSATPVLSERLQVMLDRYQQIIQMTTFQRINDYRIKSPVRSFTSILQLNQIKLAQLYDPNTHQEFVEQAAVDMKFWRMVLTKSDTLIDKMMAAAIITIDLHCLSELIRSAELSSQSKTTLALLLTPLTTEEMDMSKSLIGDASFLYHHTLVMDVASAFNANKLLPINLLLQPNATINKHYQYHLQPTIKLSQQPVEQFYKIVQSDPLNLTEYFNIGFWPSNLYNLTGKMVLKQYIWSQTKYIAKMHDLNGKISLVKLQLQLKQAEDVNIEQVVNTSVIKNPYTHQAMDLDKENNWLGFECLGGGLPCKVKL